MNKKIFILIIIGMFLILGFSVGKPLQTYCQDYNTSPKVEEIKVNEKPIEINTYYPLESLLRELINKTQIDGNCLDYTLYYKEYLNNNYPNLDVRKINLAGICPIGTKECKEWEGMKHTYLIVNGWGGECILDQHNLKCIQVIK